MNQRQFRRTTLWVCLALAAFMAGQAWSLQRMWADGVGEFRRKVLMVMNRAAFDDLLIGNGSGRMHSKTTFISRNAVDSIGIDLFHLLDSSAFSNASFSGDTLRTRIHVVRDGEKRDIVQELRVSSLSIMQFNLERYDSLVRRGLEQVGIDLPFRIDLVCGADEQQGERQTGPAQSVPAKGKGVLSARHAPDLIGAIASVNEQLEIPSPVTFQVRVGYHEALYFRLRIADPSRTLLGRMTGVVCTSLLMLLVVGGVLLYLLRTLFRQKSLEQMRLDFTHNITHELKTPIAVACTANDALEQAGFVAPAERRTRYHAVIRRQMEALTGMVERILSLATEEQEAFELQRTRIELEPLLGSLAEACRAEAPKPVQIDVRVDPPTLTGTADRFQLTLMIRNLLDNAIKYSGPQVRIELGARRRDGGVAITVADDGIGIPRAALGRVFDKYYRVPTGNVRAADGFGLGLYYVLLMARKHGGTVTVSSTPGCGTTFTLILPDDENAPAAR